MESNTKFIKPDILKDLLVSTTHFVDKINLSVSYHKL